MPLCLFLIDSDIKKFNELSKILPTENSLRFVTLGR